MTQRNPGDLHLSFEPALRSKQAAVPVFSASCPLPAAGWLLNCQLPAARCLLRAVDQARGNRSAMSNQPSIITGESLEVGCLLPGAGWLLNCPLPAAPPGQRPLRAVGCCQLGKASSIPAIEDP